MKYFKRDEQMVSKPYIIRYICPTILFFFLFFFYEQQHQIAKKNLIYRKMIEKISPTVARRVSQRIIAQNSQKEFKDQTTSVYFQKAKRQKVNTDEKPKQEDDDEEPNQLKLEEKPKKVEHLNIKIEEEEEYKENEPKSEVKKAIIKQEDDLFIWKRESNFIDIEDLHENVLQPNPYLKPFDEAEFFRKYPKDEPGPPNWRTIYASVKKMRSKVVAPVDTMGCEKPPPNFKVEMGPTVIKKEEGSEEVKLETHESEEKKSNSEVDDDGVEIMSAQAFRIHLLVSLLLSAQTKDQITSQAVENLRLGLNYDEKQASQENSNNDGDKKKPPGLSVATILATPEDKIDKLICRVGFHKRKASYLRRCAQVLRDEYNDDVPPLSVKELVKILPGFGPKMGHLFVQLAYGSVEGIGVDVHVHRLAKMWGWTTWKPKKDANKKAEDESSDRSRPERESKNINDPQFSRVRLEAWLPKDLWRDINPTMVGFGQTICPSRGARCDRCLVGARVKCPGKRKMPKSSLKN